MPDGQSSEEAHSHKTKTKMADAQKCKLTPTSEQECNRYLYSRFLPFRTLLLLVDMREQD